MNVHNHIKEQRTARKMTLDDLAAAAGISRRALVYYEKGDRVIPLDVADRLLKELDISCVIGKAA